VAERLIRCRAKLVPECYDGTPAERQVGEDGTIEEDGTYSEDGTIVCDPCYIAIMPFTKSGQALLTEIDDAIETFVANADYVRNSRDLGKCRREAEQWIAQATPGSPAHTSASAALAMVNAEERRREASDG